MRENAVKLGKRKDKRTKLKLSTYIHFGPQTTEKKRQEAIRKREKGIIAFYVQQGWKILKMEKQERTDEVKITCYLIYS